MSLGAFVRILGRGPGRSRGLTQSEAQEAFGLILSGAAAPEAVGALLMLMRYRGESAEEIAGFVTALRDSLPGWDQVPAALDWPTYAAGRSRGLPWFLLSAKLVAGAGLPVLMHGWNSHQNPVASVRNALRAIGIPTVHTSDQASEAVTGNGIAYLPLEQLSPAAFEILKLRDVLNLRSAINTTLRVLNPSRAPATVQGVFHPSYRGLQADTGALLGQAGLSVIKGGGGEFERHPGKDIAVFGLRQSKSWSGTAPALEHSATRLAEGPGSDEPDALARLWTGDYHDDFATGIVTGTAALALFTCGKCSDIATADHLAQDLWANRNRHLSPTIGQP